MTYYRIIDDMSAHGDRLQELIALLPDWRREAALRHRQEQGQRECCMAYLLLCRMLREEFGITEQPRFTIGEHGRPELVFDDDALKDRVPTLSFNLSHCRSAVACALSDTHDVGIDIECTGRYKPALADYCMSSEERQRITCADNPDSVFTTLWTRKEALLKLTGEGITDDLRSVLASYRTQGVEFRGQCLTEKGYAWSLAVRKRP